MTDKPRQRVRLKVDVEDAHRRCDPARDLLVLQ
jgi:hypothetical protein